MSSYVLDLLERHRSEGAIVDTNLALLMVVGQYDPSRIARFKRTIVYTSDDFLLLSRVLARLVRRVTIPNIATEVDNLARQLPENEHQHAAAAFRSIFGAFFELYIPTENVVHDALHAKVGLTDSIILKLAGQGRLVITDDLSLANRISSAGGDAININHVRQFVDTRN